MCSVVACSLILNEGIFSYQHCMLLASDKAREYIKSQVTARWGNAFSIWKIGSLDNFAIRSLSLSCKYLRSYHLSHDKHIFKCEMKEK